MRQLFHRNENDVFLGCDTIHRSCKYTSPQENDSARSVSALRRKENTYIAECILLKDEHSELQLSCRQYRMQYRQNNRLRFR